MPESSNTNVPKGVKGTVRKVERLGVFDLLFAGDIKTAFEVAIKNVLGPKLQDILVNFADTVTRSFVYGDNYKSSYDQRSGGTNYNKISIISSGNQTQTYQSKPADRYESVTFEFDSYEDAKGVINYIHESIAQYRLVTVLNVYNYAGLPTNQIDNNYGWSSMGDIRPEKSRNGWVVRLPKPMQIDSH